MSSTDIYNQLKKLDTVLVVEKEFRKLLHGLLDMKEMSVYVNECNVPVIKSEESVLKKIIPELKTPELVPSHCIQAKRVAKKTLSFSNHITTDVQIKKKNFDKVEETTMNVIEIVDVKCHDVNPMNMSVYSDVVSDTRKFASPNQLKKCIQVYVSNMFKHNKKSTVVYAVMTNLRECVWYMKSDFIMSCLKGLEKAVFFQQEYKDVDLAWIDSSTDFLIRAVEHGIDKYKKSRTGKM